MNTKELIRSSASDSITNDDLQMLYSTPPSHQITILERKIHVKFLIRLGSQVLTTTLESRSGVAVTGFRITLLRHKSGKQILGDLKSVLSSRKNTVSINEKLIYLKLKDNR